MARARRRLLLSRWTGLEDAGVEPAGEGLASDARLVGQGLFSLLLDQVRGIEVGGFDCGSRELIRSTRDLFSRWACAGRYPTNY